MTLLQFISRPNFSQIIVTHDPPSAEQSSFCYQILYVLNILPSTIRIPYIRSIFVTPHNHLMSPPSEEHITVNKHTPFKNLLNFTSHHPHHQVPSVSFARASINFTRTQHSVSTEHQPVKS